MPQVDENYWLKLLNCQFEPTNYYLINVQSQPIRKRVYKTLGTSVINAIGYSFLVMFSSSITLNDLDSKTYSRLDETFILWFKFQDLLGTAKKHKDDMVKLQRKFSWLKTIQKTNL